MKIDKNILKQPFIADILRHDWVNYWSSMKLFQQRASMQVNYSFPDKYDSALVTQNLKCQFFSNRLGFLKIEF